MDSYKNSIVLIGPMATGKSTIANHLAELTGYKNYPVDRLKWYYRFKNGYNIQESTKIFNQFGFGAMLQYSHQYFGVKDLKQLLTEFKGIVDLGAADTHCSTKERCEGLLNLFQDFHNVFLILPYKDSKKSVELLTSRLIARYKNHPTKYVAVESYIKENEEFVRSVFNQVLAKHVVYVNDRAPYLVAQEILYKSKLFNYEREGINVSRVS